MSKQLPDPASALSTEHKQQARRTDVLRHAANRGGIQQCVKTLQMTKTRAWTLEMTEDWTHPRITEHDKACVFQSTVEHNVASEHFNSSLAHITARPSQAKVGARKKSSTPLWRTMSPRKKAMKSPFYGRGSCNEKKRKSHKTKNSQAALLRLFSYVRPSVDPEWRSAPDGADRRQLVCLQVTRFFHFGSVLPNNPYNSPYGCEGI